MAELTTELCTSRWAAEEGLTKEQRAAREQVVRHRASEAYQQSSIAKEERAYCESLHHASARGSDAQLHADMFTLSRGRAKRLVERLQRAGHVTLGDVYRGGWRRLYCMHGVGRTAQRAVYAALHKHGFDVELFGGHVQRPAIVQRQIDLQQQVPLTVEALRLAAKRLEKLAQLLEEGPDFDMPIGEPTGPEHG